MEKTPGHPQVRSSKEAADQTDNLRIFKYWITSGADIDFALNLKKEWSLPEEVLQTPEIQQAAQSAMLLHLEKGNVKQFDKIRSAFTVPESFVQDERVIDAAWTGFAVCLQDQNIHTLTPSAAVIRERFLSPSEANEIIYKTILPYLLNEPEVALDIVEAMPLPEEFLQREPLQERARAIAERYAKRPTTADQETAQNIKNYFKIAEK